MSHRCGAAVLFLSLVGGCTTSPTTEDPARDEFKVTYQATDVDFATALEEIVRQGRLSILWEVVIRKNGSISCGRGICRVGAKFSVAVDAGVPKEVGTASVRFEEIPAREAVDALAKAFGLAVTEPHPAFVRLSKP